jgi:hypothetical protein
MKLFIGSFVATESLPLLIGTFLFSQIAYSVYAYCRSKVNFHELLAKEEYFQLSFDILKYSFSNAYDKSL